MQFPIVRLLACAFLLVAASGGLAQVPRTVFLEDLTWTELRSQIGAGKTTVIVPIGGTEQNGPHMALGKHNVRVKALAERIATALGDAIVAPVVAYVPQGTLDPPSGHLRWPGTITIPSDTFQKTLEYAARSFRLHGFRDIVFIGDHGGYQSDTKAVAEKLTREWGAQVRVHALEQYYLASQAEYSKALKAKGIRDQEIGSHAGLGDVSMMLAVDSRMVRASALCSDSARSKDDGVYGDPRRASAELGQLGVDAVVNRSVEAIRRATRR